jgi:T5SS/PEP-CTERM-associated repeat protein
MLIGDFGGGTVTGAGSILVGANGAGHVRIDGGAVTCGTMLISTGSFNGVLGTGSVEIRGGALNTGRFDIGLVGSGSATIGGTSSAAQLNITGTTGTTISSGSFASGLLRIINNGTASMGAGATVVGNSGVGTLEVLNDGVYTGTGTLVFGLNPQSAGSGLVSGSAAALTCGTLHVGSAGVGELRILNGADVSSAFSAIGATGEGAGTVVVSGAGSQWTSSQSIQVGSLGTPSGTGLLTIGPGARVATGTSLELRIGTGGHVHLDGGTLSTGTLIVNGLFDFGSGTLNITGGFGGGLTIGAGGPLGSSLVVDPTRRVNVTNTLTNNGLVRGDGTLSAGSFVNGSAGEVRVSGAEQLNITAGSFSNSGQINLFGGLFETNASLTNNPTGRISGRGVLRSGNLANNGTIALSAGVSDVFANLTNNATGKTLVTGNATSVFYGSVTNVGGSEFRVSSGATAVFLGAVTGLGQFTGSGTTIFEGPASLGVIDRTGTTLVEPSGSLVASHVRENALIVNGAVTILPNGTSAGTSRVRSLEIDGGRLDLNNNDLVIDYDGASPIQSVRQQLQSGYANGAWTGEGIATSMGNASNLGLGYADASAIFSSFPATFSGQSVDNTTVLIAFTRFGDANLDGLVNLADFNRLASNFGGTDRVWSQGDFNYDGLVNLADFNRLASNFGLSAVGTTVTPEDWAALASAVPEPAGWAVGVIGLLASARRRNRKERAACDTSIQPR